MHIVCDIEMIYQLDKIGTLRPKHVTMSTLNLFTNG